MGEQAARGGKEDVEPPPARLMTQRLGEMGLADAGRPLNEDVFVALDEARGGEIEDLLARDRGIEAEIKALEGLLEVEAGAAEPEGELLLGPALAFVFAEPRGKLDKRELRLHRLAIAELQGFEDPRESEALELGDELMGEGHGPSPGTKKSVQGRASCAAGSGGRSGWAKTSASSPCWRIRLITT